ncbi:hypothetical protein ALO95_200020 [Pseudomonas syringae pv. antirrhini]|nr:hypothetical protein ALQ23_200076 [Pseudomonas syringae pv. antirrhini]RMW23537.1 hypothetical protein ALO95_200020 [Pseudomonas syringae pv. antirrhini]
MSLSTRLTGSASCSKTRASSAHKQAITLTYKNLDRIRACQIAESEDMLFLLKRSNVNEASVSLHTIGVPKEGLLKSETSEEELRFDS